MAITTRAFGTTQDGQNVTMYTLTNHSGASVSMLDLGAIVTNILVPDKCGKLADVALGFDTLAHYEGGHGAMGDTIGRFANRIGGGCFTLDGTEYHLYQNDGEKYPARRQNRLPEEGLAGDARRGGYGGFRQVPLRFRGH